MFLDASDITKSFGKLQILRGVSLAAERGECLGIVGRSGCGKTTLLRIIAGLEKADSGTAVLEGNILFSDKVNVEPRLRSVGFVFQDLALWPHMTALANVGAMIQGNYSRADREAKAEDFLKAVQFPMSHTRQYPDELSGGEGQRVAIARAIAGEPRLLLMDEPFSHLDSALKSELFTLLRGMGKEKSMTVLYVSHFMDEIRSVTDRVVELDSGSFRHL